MEHAQREAYGYGIMSNSISLNPYFNGTCSKSSVFQASQTLLNMCLNPYFNGTCSKSSMKPMFYLRISTCLNPYFNGTCSKSVAIRRTRRKLLSCQVLILILMEHAQRGDQDWCQEESKDRVLILILMEHAQRERNETGWGLAHRCLNPYFNGTCSKRSLDMVEDERVVYVLILILMEHAQRAANLLI